MEEVKVIVADDEGIIAMDIAEILEDAGYKVVGIAKDGVEAYELGKKLKPDIFVLDIKMPRMDGIQTARRLAAEQLGPVVLLTAYSEDSLVEKAGESGVYGYLLKPVEEFSLRAAIKIALSRYRNHRQTEERHEQARQELVNRKIIEKAKGLMMERYSLSEEEAFVRLRSFAMKKGLPLEVLAARIAEQLKSKDK